MKFFVPLFLSLVNAAAVFAQTNANLPTVTTPASLIECQPAAFTISGGAGGAPYIVQVIPGGEISAAALETLPNVAAAGSFTWVVNLASGQTVSLRITDSLGNVNYSAEMSIQAGTSTSCTTSSASAASSSTSAASSASSAASSSSVTSSTSAASSSVSVTTSVAASSAAATTATTSAAATSATSASAASSAATTSATKGAAAGLTVQSGFAAVVIGAIVALAA